MACAATRTGKASGRQIRNQTNTFLRGDDTLVEGKSGVAGHSYSLMTGGCARRGSAGSRARARACSGTRCRVTGDQRSVRRSPKGLHSARKMHENPDSD